ncbi:MAG TPA: PLP-dependent aminotransferase family protein [Candidatus Limnocylindrales bacterium]|nr:PLP-dependent aminotransferase family protein [Candidatus Limnocylindrales bacterium]
MDVHVHLEGTRDLSAQIFRQLRTAVLDGRLKPGDALPPTRELARRLEVSRNTVAIAYERLAAEGFVDGRVGSGTYVRRDLGLARRPRSGPSSGWVRPRPVWASIPAPPTTREDSSFDLRAGIPDAAAFPFEAWRRLVTRELRPAAVGHGMYGDPAGLERLRAAIAHHVGMTRGVRATADDVVVTNGTQQAIDIIGRVLVEPGAAVAVEEPGYPPPARALVAQGARVVGVPVDRHGLVVDAIPSGVRLVVVTPSHQFPLGMPMPLERRLALLAWAQRHAAAIVEDDYDSQFRFAGRPIEPLQTLDRDGRVIYVGTFSKVMLPTLRLAFIVAPASIRQAVRSAKFVNDWHTALPTQAALATFIEEGTLARHIRRMRDEYATRQARILEILERDFGDTLEVIPSTVGMHLAAWLRPAAGDDARDIARRARTLDVGLYPISQFAAEPSTPPGLVLGYGAIPRDRIEEGLSRLEQAIRRRRRVSAGSP